MSRLLPLMHLCDSLFPTGGFAHSDGLETATASGLIATGQDFRHWLTSVRDHSLRGLEAPAVSQAWRASRAGRLADVVALDDQVHALRPSASGRAASRAMGGRLLKAWQTTYPAQELDVLQAMPGPLTLPVAFGCVCASAGITEPDAVGGYMYTRLASSLSAAMRLMPLGQQQGHRILAECLDAVPAIAASIVGAPTPLRSFTPALDIAAMRHQHLHSRLFLS